MAFEEIEETDEYEEIYKVVPYWGDNERIRSQIAFVLLKVPDPVRNFAYRQCLFSSLDEQREAGTCTKLRVVRPDQPIPSPLWLIELSERIPYEHSFRYRKYSETFFRHLVAHELAHAYHAYLNHDGIYPEDKARADKLEWQREAEADRLAKQWGFEPPMSHSMAVPWEEPSKVDTSRLKGD